MKWPDGHLDGRAVSASTYQQHGCRCEGCRELATARVSESRRRRPNLLANQRRYNKARHRAISRLVEKHRKEFLRLLGEERRAS